MQDIRVRQAVDKALDFDAIAAYATGGYAGQALGYISDYVPFSADGIYIGYSGASGLQGSSPYVECADPIPAGQKYKSFIEISGLGGLSGFSFFMELYDGTSLVAYSDLADFETVWDATSEQGMLVRWKPSMTSYVVPEPTSGLLLLLGGALLGLRRKRRVA